MGFLKRLLRKLLGREHPIKNMQRDLRISRLMRVFREERER